MRWVSRTSVAGTRHRRRRLARCHDGAASCVADDNADMRDYLRACCGQYWTVEVVADGSAAPWPRAARRA